MKGIISLLFLLLIVSNVLGQSSALSGIPNCGLVCLEAAISASTACAATNTTCVCLDAILQAEVTQCVSVTCNVKESLAVKNATTTLCGAPIRDKTVLYNTLNIALGSISGTVLLLRLVSKLISHIPITADDYFVILAFSSGLPNTVLTPLGLTKNGMGRDIWTVTPKQITDFIHVFYVEELLYFAQVALLKLSLCAFYLRIFPGKAIKRVILATALVDLLFGTIFVLIGVFQCKPISYYWKSWDLEHKGICLNVNVIGWSNAVISIVLDVWMLGIPISQLLKLQLHWKKKLSVAIMFAVGTFVTVISIVRLQALVHFANSPNPTWDNLGVGIWSTVEINVGIICVSMPNLRLILMRLFPRVFGSTQHTDRKNYINDVGHSHIGGNISTNHTHKSSKYSQLGSGIVTSRTYTVQYGREREGDEVELAQMGGPGRRPEKTSHQTVK